MNQKKKIMFKIVCLIGVFACLGVIGIKAYHMYGNVHRKLDTIIQNQTDLEAMSSPDESIPSEGNVESAEDVESIALKELLDILDIQEETDKMLLAELESGGYTFEDPLVVLDPYGIAPLSALILFSTDEPSVVSLEIAARSGLDADSAVADFSSNGYTTDHVIPVYGLYADSENEVKLTLITKDQQIQEKIVRITTEPLIANLSNIAIITNMKNSAQYQPGLNFSYSGLNQAGMKKAFDSQGNIRWFLNKRMEANPSNYVNSECVYFKCLAGDLSLIYRMNLMGRIDEIYPAPQKSYHDIFITNKNTMIFTTMTMGTIAEEDSLLELDMNTGNILRSLDYKTILPRMRNEGSLYSLTDWMHLNSVVCDGDDVIVSSNYQSSVVKNDWNGNIKWILSSPQGWYDIWRPYLLTPIGDDFEYPYNQHAVDILPDVDDNPDTVDIILFDNGSSRNHVENLPDETPLYSRLVWYRINEKEMTVEQVWTFGKDYPELFSKWKGDVDLLENGNFYGTFNQTNRDGKESNTIYVEVDQNKNIVWECYATSKTSDPIYSDYRSERMSIYEDDVKEYDLQINVKNLIPDETMKQYGISQD